jgi:type II secretory pathway pseudopilin PulG
VSKNLLYYGCKGQSLMNRHRSTTRSQFGFTYIGVMILVAVMGISLTATSTYWSTTMQRERETELLFRGEQYRRAIESYCNSGKKGNPPEYPRRLEDLLKDPRSLAVRRHIRKLYPDPVNKQGEWALIMDKGGGIKGVASRSSELPLKTGGFPSRYEAFEKARAYKDWKFIYEPDKKKDSVQQQGAEG